MTSIKTNWQAWVLAFATGAATIAWYVTGRNYTGRIGSILLVAAAASCLVAAALYVGRALGNRTLNQNLWLNTIAAFGTVLTALFGVWEFILDVGGNGTDFDYAVGWGAATVATLVLGYAEIRKAGQIVADLANDAQHQLEQ